MECRLATHSALARRGFRWESCEQLRLCRMASKRASPPHTTAQNGECDVLHHAETKASGPRRVSPRSTGKLSPQSGRNPMMHCQRPHVLAWAICVLVLPPFLGAARAEEPGSRKLLEVVRGRCLNCQLAYKLGRIQMVTAQEGWADGWFFPTIGEGTGDNTVLHTTDGGRAWTQVSAENLIVDQHGGDGPGPLFFFLDRRYGWIWWMNVPEARVRLARTEDGGRTWRTRDTEALGAQLRFFDRLHGYALGFDLRDSAFLLTTDDAGETWAKHALPFRSGQCAAFLNPRIGYAAGSDKEGRPAVVTTSDGGRTWVKSITPHLPRDTRAPDYVSNGPTGGWL